MPGLNSSSADEQAFFWVARLSSVYVSDRDKELFAEWLAASPRHPELFDEAASLWAKTGEIESLRLKYPLAETQPRDHEWQSVDHNLGGAGTFLRWASAIKVAAFGVFAAMIAFVATAGVWLTEPTQVYSTKNGESQSITLADGSVVALSAGTQIAVEYTDDQRNVELIQGEAFFDVVSVPDRPFVVRTGDEIISVVGTMFNVLALSDRVEVSVLEGAVNVAHRELEFMPIIEFQDSYAAGTLGAGEALEVFEGTQLTPVKTLQDGQIASWRYGVLTFIDEPLDRVVSDLNRHFASDIRIADRRIGDLQVTAVFQMGDVNQPLRMLEQILPISVSTDDNQRITLKEDRSDFQ